MELAESLPSAFSNYSFQIKHVILSFVKSSGITLSDNIERFFGIVWDFNSDQFTPALEVWLRKKTRGQHIDAQLSPEMIESCTFTRRVLLRVVGSLHDISGKMLVILQIKARLIYGKVCQQTKDLGWDSVITHPDLVKMMQQLLYDIVQVKEELEPFDRAWIKENYQLNMVIGPLGRVIGRVKFLFS